MQRNLGGPILENFKPPHFETFDGKRDPLEHLAKNLGWINSSTFTSLMSYPACQLSKSLNTPPNAHLDPFLDFFIFN